LCSVKETAMVRRTVSLAGAAAVAYAGVVAGTFALQRKLIYFPDTQRPDLSTPGAERFAEVVFATADGLDLLAWYAPPRDGEAPVLVYFHGNGGSIAMRAAKLAPYLEAGCGALLVEYRGYGGNPGRPSEAGLYADGHGALDWLERQGIAPPRLVLYGESLGTGVAVELALSRSAGALVLEAPFTSLADIGARAYPWLPVRALVHDRYESLAKIGRLRVPVMVIHGEADRMVPAEMGRALLAAAAEPKRGLFLPGVGHEELIAVGAPQAVLDWLATL
jgi:fermentation-respiration switch protein FrsA (DUF1100 family)